MLADEDKDLYAVLASDEDSPDDLVTEWHQKESVERVLSQMNPKVSQMVRYRFGLDDGIERTFREIGEMVGVSSESARRTVVKTLSQLSNDHLLDLR
jgi:DNA-directed RNA polymerase sigma subunit (sigma70/sigma32)